MSTLLLIDGHAMAYRAYYAMIKTGLMTTHGEPTGAVYGFVNMLLSAIGLVEPTHMAVCFDAGRATFRTERYPAYKAQRKPTPEALRSQFPLIRQVVSAFGLPIYHLDGYEADDVIGSIAGDASELGFMVKVLTGDRDLFQIVSPEVTVLMPSTGIGLTEYDSAGVFEKMGVLPEQIIDYKGLAGDASDNIPGVPGIGDIRAVKLLAEYRTMAGVYANLASLSGKIRNNLQQYREQAELSYWLATINCLAPVDGLNWQHCEVKTPDMDTLSCVLERLAMFSLMQELPKHLFGLGRPVAPTEVFSS